MWQQQHVFTIGSKEGIEVKFGHVIPQPDIELILKRDAWSGGSDVD